VLLIGLFALTGALQPAYAQSCTHWVSPATGNPPGNDSNAGTQNAPWATVQKAFNTATAGQTVCFYGGTYPRVTTNCTNFSQAYSQCEITSGTAANPITFTNVSGQVALIQGSTRIDASYITVYGTPNTTANCGSGHTCGLIFEGNQDNATDPVDICCATGVNPQFVKFDHVEIRKGTYHAGLYEEGCNNTITGSYVHDNGNGTSDSGHTLDNGIYWSRMLTSCTNGGLIANNLVEHNWSKGIQLYCGQNTNSSNTACSASTPTTVLQNVTVEENTSVNNDNYGAVINGSNNVFANNILYNNADVITTSNQAGVYTFDSNHPHVIDHDITWDTSSSSRRGWYDPNSCGCVTNNTAADPQFVSPSTLNWHILGSSPAVGFSNQSYVQTVDHDGVVRSSPADTGAYQY
jgi:hypothetical protein